MKIFNAEQIRAWDAYTIDKEPISSIDLMERAARMCADWLLKNRFDRFPFKIFCGKGNNGGDGLVIARVLAQAGVHVEVYILEFGKPGTNDFQVNLQRLHDFHDEIHFIQTEESFPEIKADDIVIDALLGSGLNKPVEGLTAALIEHINQSTTIVIAIDLPSGMYIDRSSKGNTVLKVVHTLSFQFPKLAFMMAENAEWFGMLHILDIELHPQYYTDTKSEYELLDADLVKQIWKPRLPFAHKGHFGHALLIAGSYGKMGAAVLAAKACLRSGVGLLTCFVPACGYEIMQTAVPEAMVITDKHERMVTDLPNHIETYNCIGIGPGIGTADETRKLLSFIVRRYDKPMVIDADGLNSLSMEKGLAEQLPANTIITPHPKEFDRMFGAHDNDFDRIKTAREKAKELNIIIILKGHHSLITTPGGLSYFNNTGNAGMAKGGSGDVLTGILTALVCQGYDPVPAAILGVWLHGMAGDIALQNLSPESILARDIIHNLPVAFTNLGQGGLT